MQPYDEKAWRQIEERRRRIGAWRVRAVVPQRVRELGKEVAVRGKEGFVQLPGSEQLQQVISQALGGVVAAIGTAAAASVSQRAVLRRYARHGHALARIEAIQALDLEVSDAVFPRRKRLVYMSASAAQCGVAGAASLVTEAGTVVGGVAGAGAGAVPGVLALATVLAADAVVKSRGVVYRHENGRRSRWVRPAARVASVAFRDRGSGRTWSGRPKLLWAASPLV